MSLRVKYTKCEANGYRMTTIQSRTMHLFFSMTPASARFIDAILEITHGALLVQEHVMTKKEAFEGVVLFSPRFYTRDMVNELDTLAKTQNITLYVSWSLCGYKSPLVKHYNDFMEFRRKADELATLAEETLPLDVLDDDQEDLQLPPIDGKI